MRQARGGIDGSVCAQVPASKPAGEEARAGRQDRQVAVDVSNQSSARPPAGDSRLNRGLCGGILADKGCYCVNTARFMFGSEPSSVYAKAEYGAESGVDERMTATLYFPEGKVAHFDCSFCLTGTIYSQNYELFGESGRVYVPRGFSQVDTYRYGVITGTSFFIVKDEIGNPVTEKIDVEAEHQWRSEAEYFADRILRGESIEPPAEDGRANATVMEAIYKSAREDRIVFL